LVVAAGFGREPANRFVAVSVFAASARFGAVALFGASVAGSTVVIFTFEA
jgi:membrane protein DedA with SNARE-associated domain